MVDAESFYVIRDTPFVARVDAMCPRLTSKNVLVARQTSVDSGMDGMIFSIYLIAWCSFAPFYTLRTSWSCTVLVKELRSMPRVGASKRWEVRIFSA